MIDPELIIWQLNKIDWKDECFHSKDEIIQFLKDLDDSDEISTLEYEISQMVTQYDELDDKNDDLEIELKNIEEKNDKLEDRISELQDKIEELTKNR